MLITKRWLAWSEAWEPLDTVLHSLNEQGELLQWLSYDDSGVRQ